MTKPESLILLIDSESESYCYYNTVPRQNREFLGPEEIREVLDWCQTRSISPVLCLPSSFAADYSDVLATGIPKILPLRLLMTEAGKQIRINNEYDIVVVNEEDLEFLEVLPNDQSKILNLRIPAAGAARLKEIFRACEPKAKRINLFFTDMESVKEGVYPEYEQALTELQKELVEQFPEKPIIELSFLTDRIVLHGMNNCNAGITHITCGPDKKFYLCPGFYFHPIRDGRAGSPDEGITVRNGHLLTTEYAPICSHCDAFHCKRCVFLNKVLTYEVNTPSKQQCVLSHIERNASVDLLNGANPSFARLNPGSFEKTTRFDPFEWYPRNTADKFLFDRNGQPPATAPSGGPDLHAELDRIYRMLDEILHILKNKP